MRWTAFLARSATRGPAPSASRSSSTRYAKRRTLAKRASECALDVANRFARARAKEAIPVCLLGASFPGSPTTGRTPRETSRRMERDRPGSRANRPFVSRVTTIWCADGPLTPKYSAMSPSDGATPATSRYCAMKAKYWSCRGVTSTIMGMSRSTTKQSHRPRAASLCQPYSRLGASPCCLHPKATRATPRVTRGYPPTSDESKRRRPWRTVRMETWRFSNR